MSQRDVFLKNFVNNFGVSCLSASLAHIPHHPLYTLKSQMMFKGRHFTFQNFFLEMYKTKGTFLFRGVVPRSFGIAPEKALKMLVWDTSIRLTNHFAPQCSSTMRWLIAGSAAGAATTVFGCPSERAMVLAQISRQGLIEVVQKAGLRGLYHGVEATLYRDISFNMALFTLRGIIMSWYEERYRREPSAFLKIWWGLPACIAASVVACPFDVVKTRIQGKKLNPDGTFNTEQKRALQFMFHIARHEGPRYLFKGLLPRLIAVPLYMSVFLMVNEELQKLILDKRILT